MAKVSFTLPISCQICLGKVKEPVLCPNQHVFCMRCMDAWLECHQRCPTCRIDITPQSPIRKIIGNQDDCKRSPKISREIRKIRMQRLINEYEDDVQSLQSEVESLHSTNQDLKTQLNSAPGGSKCTRCYLIDDVDDMLAKTKRLQAMTETFDEMKVDCKRLRERNEELVKANEDLKRHNEKIKLEIQTRSPMKFGRLTVLTLESRLSDYEKQVSQLKKALECNDKHNESLQKQLQACVCGAGNFDVTQRSLLDKIEVSNFMKSGKKEKVSRKLDLQQPEPGKGQEVIGYVEGSDIYLSPFTPSAKFSQMHIQTPGSEQNMILRQMLESKDSNSQDSGISTGHSSQDDLCDQPEPKVIRSFSAQEMPAVESPDYKQKLEQIQDNLLHPITHAESNVHQTKTFSRRLTFEDGNITNEDGRQVDLSAFLNLDETSNVSEVMLLPSEDSRMSVGDGQGSEPVFESYIESSTPHDADSHFAMPQRPATLYMSQPPTELTEASSNPVLTSLIRSESCKETLHKDPVNIVSDDGKSVMDVCGARITTTKLSQQERDLFARPSSAPSRTFLLSGSRFSALRPLDPATTDARDNSGFQPVKCKSPSPLTMRKQFTKPVRPVSSPVRGTPDKRAPSPLLRLVSPDDVINTKWKQTSATITPVPSRALPVSSHMSPVQPQMAPTCSHSGFSTHGSPASSFFAPVSPFGAPLSPHSARQPTPNKGTSSRVAILKRRSSGKLSQMANAELKSNEETASVSARKNSRKQRLVMRDDLRTKRSGDHSLNFISPLKSPKYDGH